MRCSKWSEESEAESTRLIGAKYDAFGACVTSVQFLGAGHSEPCRLAVIKVAG